MLEIIAIIFLAKHIGSLAHDKGLKAGWWRFYTVAAWIIAEVVGVITLKNLFPDNPVVFYGGAIALAVISFFIVKAILNNKPGRLINDEINQIGSQPHVDNDYQ